MGDQGKTLVSDVADIKAQLAGVNEQLKAANDARAEIKKTLDQVNESLNGNGQPGIKTRLDRLEQIEARRVWNLRAIWLAVLTAIGKQL